MEDNFFEFSKKKYAFLALVCLAQNYFAYWWMGGHPMWIILAAAFWAVVFLTPLAMDVILQAVRRRATREEESQGVNYMFGRTAVRVMYSSDRVWLATEDVYHALGLKLDKEELRKLQISSWHSIVPGTQITGISEDHVRKFALSTTSPEAQRFALWFEREVLHPIRHRVAQRMHIPEEVD
jgi:hypothetical protein